MRDCTFEPRLQINLDFQHKTNASPVISITFPIEHKILLKEQKYKLQVKKKRTPTDMALITQYPSS